MAAQTPQCPGFATWARPREEACLPRACLLDGRLSPVPKVGERGLFAPALLVARPALTGFVPQPSHLIFGTSSYESTRRPPAPCPIHGPNVVRWPRSGSAWTHGPNRLKPSSHAGWQAVRRRRSSRVTTCGTACHADAGTGSPCQCQSPGCRLKLPLWRAAAMRAAVMASSQPAWRGEPRAAIACGASARRSGGCWLFSPS